MIRNYGFFCLSLVLLAGLPTKGRADSRPDIVPLAREVYRNGPRWAKELTAWLKQREGVEMMGALLQGSHMGPGEGWFHPGKSRFDFNWLARHNGSSGVRISRKDFRGPAVFFDRLDRDHDGFITPQDFDWSESSIFLRQQMQARMLFYMFDGDSNGRITRQEWDRLFKRLAGDKDFVTQDDIGKLFQIPPQQKNGPKTAGPTMAVLFKGLLAGELGSFFEGPAVNHKAPAFTLPTHDGKQKFSLSQFQGKKPVVLIFGSFT